MDEERPDILVIGIGNILKRDDGLGIQAVRYLQGKVPDGVETLEGSTYAADLLPSLEGRRAVIIIDGVEAGEEPGAVFRFAPEEVRRALPTPSLSIHDFGLYDLLEAARMLGQLPERVVIVAVQVKDLGTGMELSREVRDALPGVHGLVLEEIEKVRGT